MLAQEHHFLWLRMTSLALLHWVRVEWRRYVCCDHFASANIAMYVAAYDTFVTVLCTVHGRIHSTVIPALSTVLWTVVNVARCLHACSPPMLLL